MNLETEIFDKIIGNLKSLKLNKEDFSEVKYLFYRFYEDFYEKDKNDLIITSVEEEHKVANFNIRAFMDFTALLKDRENNRYGNYESIIVDWKTDNNKIIDKDKYKYSWQWKIYCFIYGADLFSYRVISKQTGEIKEILLNFTNDLFYQTKNYIYQCCLLRNTLKDFLTYPRNMPFACNAYGRECLHKKACWSDNVEKAFVPVREFSYSGISTFLLCPERYRLDSLLGKEETRELGIGKAVHDCLALLYTYLKEEQKKCA